MRRWGSCARWCGPEAACSSPPLTGALPGTRCKPCIAAAAASTPPSQTCRAAASPHASQSPQPHRKHMSRPGPVTQTRESHGTRRLLARPQRSLIDDLSEVTRAHSLPRRRPQLLALSSSSPSPRPPQLLALAASSPRHAPSVAARPAAGSTCSRSPADPADPRRCTPTHERRRPSESRPAAPAGLDPGDGPRQAAWPAPPAALTLEPLRGGGKRLQPAQRLPPPVGPRLAPQQASLGARQPAACRPRLKRFGVCGGAAELRPCLAATADVRTQEAVHVLAVCLHAPVSGRVRRVTHMHIHLHTEAIPLAAH